MKSIGFSIAIVYAEKTLRLISVFGTVLAMATMLPIEDVGMVSFAYSLFSICYVITILGLDTITIKKLIEAQVSNQTNRVMGTVFYMRLLVAVILAITTFFLICIWWEKETLALYTICINSGLIILSVEVIDSYFQSRHMERYLSVFKIIAILLGFCIKLIAVFWTENINWILISVVLDYLLIAIFTVAAYKSVGGAIIEWSFDTNAVKGLLGLSRPILASSLLVVLIFQMDRMLIGFLKTGSELGVYSLSVQFASIFNALPVAFGSVWAPILCREKKNNHHAYLNSQKKAIKTLFLASIAAAFISFFLLFLYFYIYIDADLHDAISIFVVYAAAMIFVYQVSLRSRILIIENHGSFIAKISFLAVCLCLATNFYFINAFGSIGASYASLLTWASSVLLLPLLWKETREFPKLFLMAIMPEILYGTITKRKN